MRYFLFAIIVILIDQFTKWLVVTKMSVGGNIPVWSGIVSITSSRNQGAAFSILQGKMWFFYIITVIVVVGVVYYLQKVGRHRPLLGVALSLVLGGAIGNFIDRIFRGEVVDFIYFRVIDFPIFNAADSALSIGVVLLLIYTFLEGKEEKKRESSQANGQ